MDLRLIDATSLAIILGVNPRTIKEWRRDGKIPKPLIQSTNKCFWSIHQIEAWQKNFEAVNKSFETIDDILD